MDTLQLLITALLRLFSKSSLEEQTKIMNAMLEQMGLTEEKLDTIIEKLQLSPNFPAEKRLIMNDFIMNTKEDKNA